MIEKAPFWVNAASALVRNLPFGRYRSLEYFSTLQNGPFLTSLPRSAGGASFVADLRDSICREVCFTGKYEPQETVLIQKLLRPGMTFVDVGANWGYFTLLAASHVGPAGKVVSLEPDPRLFGMLARNVFQNRFAHVTTLPIAAAQGRTTLTLDGFDENGSNWGLSKVADSDGFEGHSFRVEALDLDEIISQHCPAGVDVLKMDIEGAEDLALSGFTKSLRNAVCRCITLELHPALLQSRGSSPQQALAPLIDYGYQLFRIDHSLKVNRRAAYSKLQGLAEILRPLECDTGFDAWPHLLCLAPYASLAELLS